MTATRKLISLLIFFLSFGSTLLFGQGSFAVSGTIVTPQGVLDHGTMLIRDGKIQDIGADITIPNNVLTIKVEGIVFPGLIDLHNHLVWNVLPRWKLPALVTTRYEWQAMPEYRKRLSGPEGDLLSKGLACDMERYAEIKALLNGATSVTGSLGPSDSDPKRNECVKGLARNLDVFSGLYSDRINAEPLRYEIFPLEISWQQAQVIRDGLGSGQIKAVIFHVGEGKDASANREFRMFRARGFLRPGATIIHGVALHESEFREMAANQVGLVWSPRSNLELYGQTADIAAAKAGGVTIALAPDWSPTGSSGLLDELRFAFRWDAAHEPRLLSESELLQMVTTNPARLASINDKVGSLAPGMVADFIVLPRNGDSPLLALVNSEPASVELVVVGGRALLGNSDYMRQLHPGKKLESLTVCGKEKALDILDDTSGQSLAVIEDRLTSALQPFGISLAPLSECK